MVIPTHRGRAHLERGLPAVLALRGLDGPDAVLVVDDASGDGTAEWARSRPEGPRVLELAGRHGFARAANAGVADAGADRVLLLNDDTVPAPDALEALGTALDAGATCAGARLVTLDGRRLDFDGGGATLTGHGHPLGRGRPIPRGVPATRPTLFACGAALLVDRAAFLDAGGFEPSYEAYYEDVDLGWRLNLAGRAVWHAPAATVRHVGGGSAHHLDDARRRRLHERNALATVARCIGDELLPRALPAAVALAAVRAGAPEGVIDDASDLAAGELPVPAPGWSGWPAIEDLGIDWGALAAGRRRVQESRRRRDRDVLPLLALPWTPVPPTPAMRRATARADRHFGVVAALRRCLS